METTNIITLISAIQFQVHSQTTYVKSKAEMERSEVNTGERSRLQGNMDVWKKTSSIMSLTGPAVNCRGKGFLSI